MVPGMAVSFLETRTGSQYRRAAGQLKSPSTCTDPGVVSRVPRVSRLAAAGGTDRNTYRSDDTDDD